MAKRCWSGRLFEVMPYWEETIAPALKAGKTVFVAAHGNSIRAIVKMWLDQDFGDRFAWNRVISRIVRIKIIESNTHVNRWTWTWKLASGHVMRHERPLRCFDRVEPFKHHVFNVTFDHPSDGDEDRGHLG